MDKSWESRIKFPWTWELSIFRRKSPSLSRESKLIGSIFPVGIWWICLASFRAEFLWRHRFFGLFSIAFGLTSHRSKLTLHSKAIYSLHETKTKLTNRGDQRVYWERDTHIVVNALCVLFDQVMTLFVPRLEYNSKSKFSRNHITMAELYFCFEGKDEHMFRSNTVKIMTILLFRVSKFFRV